MGDITATNDADKATVTLHGKTAAITAGITGASGSLSLSDEAGARKVVISCGDPPPVRWKAPAENVTLDGRGARAVIGSETKAGNCVVCNDRGVAAVELRGSDGSLRLRSGENEERAALKSSGVLVLKDDHQKERLVATSDGILAIKDDKARDRVLAHSGGSIILRGVKEEDDAESKDRIVLHAGNAYVAVGGHGWPGGIALFPEKAKDHGDWSQAAITMSAKSGDIVLANADCAEYFDTARGGDLEPGMVAVLDADGRIRACEEGYDTRVAGVISGAGGFKPGLILDSRRGAGGRRPVALLGKVFCRLDAQYGAVRAGDLLTTSPTAGHAMKASDRGRAFGAVLGKALRPLDAGCALVPILVTLK